MRELLGEFAKYTPHSLIRLIADGATAILYEMTNVVGLVLYAFFVGWIVDKLISFFGSILVSLRTRRWLTNSQIPIGTPRARIGAYLPIIVRKVLEVWIGLPVLYVLSVILSNENGAAAELRQLVSGYSWQDGAIARIPLYTWLNFSHSSFLQLAVSIIAAFLYLNNVYIYYANGFFLAKQVREASDLLLPIALGPNEPNPTPERIFAGLKGQGWEDEAVKSALWFLFSSNVRITSKNVAYTQMSPRQYGLFRTASSLGIMLVLKALHPLVAAMKVYFEKKDIGKVRRSVAIYQKHLARLPEPIQSKLKQLSPQRGR
jgi:hypothetical protein